MIDTHIHLVPPRLPGTGPLHLLLKLPYHSRADTLRHQIRSAGLTHLLAMGQLDTPETDPLGINSTLDYRPLIPELHVIGVADPRRGEDNDHMRRVEAELAQGKVVALKGYLGYLHYGPEHPGYRRYYELAARYNTPVIFHTGDTYSPEAKLKYAHPLGVDEVAVDHPETKFVLAHLGNPWFIDAAEVIYKNLNVWADLSGLLVGTEELFDEEEQADRLADLAADLRKAIRYCERPNRLLFGSDWPLIPIREYSQFIAAQFPEHHHEQLFEENARRLFGL